MLLDIEKELEKIKNVQESSMVLDVKLKDGTEYLGCDVEFESIIRDSDRVVIKRPDMGLAIEIIPFSEIAKLALYNAEDGSYYIDGEPTV